MEILEVPEFNGVTTFKKIHQRLTSWKEAFLIKIKKIEYMDLKEYLLFSTKGQLITKYI